MPIISPCVSGIQGKPLTFEQFQSWAQQTPAIQALLQGAFPSDAHFSLATSPRQVQSHWPRFALHVESRWDLLRLKQKCPAPIFASVVFVASRIFLAVYQARFSESACLAVLPISDPLASAYGGYNTR